MNKVILIGNLTQVPKYSKTSNGIAVCKFSIAVSRNYGGDNKEKITDFFNCTAWRNTADNIAHYCVKGSKVAVIGSLENHCYKDKEGNTRTVIEINAIEVEFLASPKRKEEDEMQEVETDELPF